MSEQEIRATGAPKWVLKVNRNHRDAPATIGRKIYVKETSVQYVIKSEATVFLSEMAARSKRAAWENAERV